jgi:hypothetical protein
LNKWGVQETTPDSGIDVGATAGKIMDSISDPDMKYWALDDVTLDYKNYNNCNTALEETRVSN